jgi:hypothetical protein
VRITEPNGRKFRLFGAGAMRPYAGNADGGMRMKMNRNLACRRFAFTVMALTHSKKSKIIHSGGHSKRRGIRNSGVARQRPRGT